MQEDLHNELSEAPLLRNLKSKQTPLAAPPQYFETFSNNILEKIKTESASHTSQKPIHTMRNWWRIAASVLLLSGAFGGYWWYASQTTTVVNDAFADISDDEILNYIDTNIDDFDDDMLAQHLLQTNTNTTDTDSVIDFLDDNLDDVEAEELLMD
ncbi:MAG: hypothetical protein KA974_01985 [Saprospiraceae bacterium]|nr:hypothetical protein [Saprospiraceae bacterium]MBP7679853.1 hypothetical protein [Saprospiraceae bacterium]